MNEMPNPNLLERPPPQSLILTLAVATGLIVANIYYIQPLAGLIGNEFGTPEASKGLFVTFAQLGYMAGLLFVVPLSDLVENRRLIATILFCLCAALAVIASATSTLTFFISLFAVGIASTAVQVIVPFAGHLASDATRGRVVGSVMSGLFFGIMLARPFASFVTYYFGWRSLFFGSAILMGLLALVLRKILPLRFPITSLGYRGILLSLIPLARDTPLLQRRALYHSACFGAFSLYWTAIPLLLMKAPYEFSQIGIGLFSLAGAAGAIAAPLAGRAADRGLIRPLTISALVSIVVAFAIAAIGHAVHSVTVLLAAALVLDLAVSVNLIISQRAIFSLSAEMRGRLNSLFMAAFFISGAIGSALAGFSFAQSGWAATCATGAGFGLAALVYSWNKPD
jgi:predicted MFS family arabinose efflux permease